MKRITRMTIIKGGETESEEPPKEVLNYETSFVSSERGTFLLETWLVPSDEERREIIASAERNNLIQMAQHARMMGRQ